MKKQLFVVLFFSFTSVITFAQTAEKEAILKMVRAETEAYFKGDVPRWQTYRVKSKNASVTFVSQRGYNYLKDWDSINATFTQILKGMTKMTDNVTITNPVIEVNGNLAWAQYNQVITRSNKDTTRSINSIEMRMLNKENGQWKILSQITTNTSPVNSSAEAVEDDLNTTGYKLLSANKINDAIEVFKLNVKLHPNSWNTYDSLGEAYALSGDNELAKENYTKSIKLNPKSESGISALQKLNNQ